MPTAWMNDNDTNKWSDGLSFVQFAKNTTYHEGIRRPYEAMFGVKAKRGISLSSFPGEQIANIETEEQLEGFANTSETEEQLEETKNIEENLQPITSSHQILTETRVDFYKKSGGERKSTTASNKNVTRLTNAQIGDNVQIQVPDGDRGHTDNRNVLAVVVGIENSDFYKLANKNGTLKQLYTVRNL
ncbi:uncharacterized protein LOC129242145 [Anastrepha obliqua]|uniref:uncharacterized protein LOC129242145 n=1 Tax=Anastrepha obliqua TaxID=95512 RepID=UPI00240A3A2C|nr:uncharacterized protein LOC129242145 [Anastrepha obliqua]